VVLGEAGVRLADAVQMGRSSGGWGKTHGSWYVCVCEVDVYPGVDVLEDWLLEPEELLPLPEPMMVDGAWSVIVIARVCLSKYWDSAVLNRRMRFEFAVPMLASRLYPLYLRGTGRL
jgi:hypothetical protein